MSNSAYMELALDLKANFILKLLKFGKNDTFGALYYFVTNSYIKPGVASAKDIFLQKLLCDEQFRATALKHLYALYDIYYSFNIYSKGYFSKCINSATKDIKANLDEDELDILLSQKFEQKDYCIGDLEKFEYRDLFYKLVNYLYQYNFYYSFDKENITIKKWNIGRNNFEENQYSLYNKGKEHKFTQNHLYIIIKNKKYKLLNNPYPLNGNIGIKDFFKIHEEILNNIQKIQKAIYEDCFWCTPLGTRKDKCLNCKYLYEFYNSIKDKYNLPKDIACIVRRLKHHYNFQDNTDIVLKEYRDELYNTFLELFDKSKSHNINHNLYSSKIDNYLESSRIMSNCKEDRNRLVHLLSCSLKK